MKISVFRALTAVLFLLIPFSADAKKFSLKKANQAAVKLYKADRNKSAKRILDVILKKNKDYQPSNILMGKILADAGSYKEASKFFLRAGSFAGSSPLSYQAGLSFYEVGKCQIAIEHLRRVEKKSTLYPDSQVYRAACLARLSRPAKALRVLQLAKTPSVVLRDARRRLFTQLSRQITQNRDGRVVSRRQNFEVVYVPAQNNSPKLPKLRNKKTKKKISAHRPKARGFYRNSSPRIAFEYVTKSNDIHGFEVKKSAETFFHAGMISLFGYEYLINKIFKGSFDGRSEVQFINSNKTGSTITNVASTADASALEQDVTSAEGSHTSRLRTMFTPQARIPFSRSFSLLLPFNYEKYWHDPPESDFIDDALEKSNISYGIGANMGAGPVDFTAFYRRRSIFDDSDQTILLEQNATALLTKTWGNFNIFLDFGYLGRSLFNGDPLIGPATELAGSVKMSFLLESLSVDLTGKFLTRSSEDVEAITIDGPSFGASTIFGGEFAVKGTWIKNLDLGTTLVYENQQGYSLLIDGYTPTEVSNNGYITAGGPTFRSLTKVSFTPTPNISVHGSYEHVRSTWTTMDPADQQRFETVQGNLQNNFAISIEAKMTF